MWAYLTYEWQGVSVGGGTGSISDILDAAQLICEKVGSFNYPVNGMNRFWFLHFDFP